MSRGQEIWFQALAALHLLSIDPNGLKGATFRLRAGPVRDQLLAHIRNIAGSTTKLHPNMTDEQLFGGVDVLATLKASRLVTTNGLLQKSGWFELNMAERSSLQMAARLCQAIDQNFISPLILLDEGIDDERAPDSLRERLAFYFDLSEVRHADTEFARKDVNSDFGKAKSTARDIKILVSLAEQFGISSSRGALLALHTAKANAKANGRDKIQDEDLEIAAELVYPSRATRLPELPEHPETIHPTETQTQNDSENGKYEELKVPHELLIEAVKSLLPCDFLEKLKTQKSRLKSNGIGFGTFTKSKNRGRPRVPRKEKLDGKNRIDIVATLRAAAPFQTIRRMKLKAIRKVHIYPSDIHVKRYETRSERVMIFAVDASGSAAISRLSESKGAVELLLSQAYSRRDFVSLISFRNTNAEILLPPTRSLVQTKRRLSELPGGGGTPMAIGLKVAGEMAMLTASQGKTPLIVLLTDGKANVTLDGKPDRAKAMEQCHQIGRWIASSGLQSVVLDVGKWPNKALAHIARDMQAAYYALPRADAKLISKTIGAELEF